MYRHAGDLGNVTTSAEGVTEFKIVDKVLTLIGPESIIGRCLVVIYNTRLHRRSSKQISDVIVDSNVKISDKQNRILR